MAQHYNYSLTELDNMLPWEREIYVGMLKNHIEEENETYCMVTNLSCPECHCFVEVYFPNESTQKEYKDYEKEKRNER